MGTDLAMTTTMIALKFNGKDLDITLDESCNSLADLKALIQGQTAIAPQRQKLLGLKKRDGKAPDDNTLLSELAPQKPGTRYMLMGTPDAVLEQAAKEAAEAPEVQDDLDVQDEEGEHVPLKDQPEVKEKLMRRIQSVNVKVLNEPRPGKKCLVLDIDYTLFDLGSAAERPEQLARPFLHEFLAAAYEHYDLIIWSATSMKWVEVKMRELGVLGHEQYKITCMLDHAAMVTVKMEKYGVFDCKPLAFIWAKFPDFYNEGNTIMFDDLRQNFVLNPQQGLKIRAYKKSYQNRATDVELRGLTHYLLLIAELPSLADLNHRRWEEYCAAASSHKRSRH